MRRLLLLAGLAGLTASAQQTVAPSNEPVGRARGEEYNGYVVNQSWEVGYRFHTVGGNEGKYRSDVNFGNGLRLLSGRFSMNSKDGRAKWFDELLFNSQGLGNDPYEFANFRLGKNRIYRYDGLWRRNDYFNPALPVIGGQHFQNTIRYLQDHDFTLLPESAVRFFLGFSRNTQSGPALTTVNLDGSTSAIYPLFADIRRSQNEFRYGNEFRIAGIRVNWLGAQEWFKEEIPATLSEPTTGLFPDGRMTLQRFDRSQPYEGTTPSWRVNLFREQGEHWALNGKATYSRGYRNFTTQETFTGISSGASRNQQTVVGGEARRPVTTANLTASVFASTRLTITNHTGYHDVRMYGDAQYQQVENNTLNRAYANFDYLGIRNFTNVTTLNYAWKPWVALRGGYQYATRQIDSVERISEDGFTDIVRAEQRNHLNAGIAGVRLQPVKPLTLIFDGELGRNDRPFSPVAERNYHGLGARAMYKQKTLTLSAIAQTNYNFNSVTLSVHSSRTRRYAFDAAWAPKAGLSFEAGYSKLHLDTATGLAYFANFRLIRDQQSLFYSNIHAINAGARIAILQRADLYLGYSGVTDRGDGRSSLGATPFERVQTYPMEYHSPLARLSVRLHNKLRWNFGYQYYGYHEDLYPVQNYRAHTGYTSLLFTF